MNIPPIDVIVPVYRGLAETQRCIESVLRARQQTPFELIAINDASPEPALTTWLRELAAAGRLTLLENDTNLGFVRTVNRGMSLHPDRDVILLNSDTEVANDWLDRLAACAARNPRAGTLTPFSNNATICSYPFEGWTGGVPGSLGLAGLDSLIATTLTGQVVDIPTGVGFCMYIRRSCLDEVGLFDAERFGRGYGEENDFCRRAATRGWANLLAADVFVFHEGGVSFSAERFALQQKAMAILLERHPDYLDVVHEFIRQAPTAPLRARLDQARRARSGAEEAEVRFERSGRLRPCIPYSTKDQRPVQLHICHNWGGGTDRWIRDFCSHDVDHRNLLLRSVTHHSAASLSLELLEPTASDRPLLRWELELPIRAASPSHPEYAAILERIVHEFHVASLIISSLIGHSLEALGTGRPSIVVLHDLFPFCPALFACYEGPCSTCTSTQLRHCLKHNPLTYFWHNTSPDDWEVLRPAFARALNQAHVQIVAPSQSVHDRWQTLLPILAQRPWAHIEHGIDVSLFPRLPAPPALAGRRPRIVIPGRLAPHKGFPLLRSLLPALTTRADVLLLGSGTFGQALAGQPGVEMIENYDLPELASHLGRFQPDLALLISVLPESFSYTLSEMRALGIPVLATRVGAFAERIHDGHDGALAEPSAEALDAALSTLLANPDQLERLRSAATTQPPRSVSVMIKEYAELLPTPQPSPHAVPALIDALRTNAELKQQLLDLRIVRDEETHRHLGTIDAQCHRQRELESKLNEQAVRLQEIRSSTSWRISAPLRYVGLAAKRLLAPVAATPASAPRMEAPPERPQVLPLTDPHHLRTIRHQIRDRFGIPDRARVVLSWSAPTTGALGSQFIRLAEHLSLLRVDVCTLIASGSKDSEAWNACRESMLTLSATRRLFFAEPLFERSTYIAAADLVLVMDEESLGTDAPVAAALGIPVLHPKGLARPDWLPAALAISFTASGPELADTSLLERMDSVSSALRDEI